MIICNRRAAHLLLAARHQSGHSRSINSNEDNRSAFQNEKRINKPINRQISKVRENRLRERELKAKFFLIIASEKMIKLHTLHRLLYLIVF